MGSVAKMYRVTTFLFILVLQHWVACTEAPVEMVEENEIKEKDSDKQPESKTQKVLSNDNEREHKQIKANVLDDPKYQKLYRDMLNENLNTKDDSTKGDGKTARTVLDSTNFEATVKKGYTFVKFYAPWCGHCKEMAPDWNDLANYYFEKPITGVDLTIAEVDCVDSTSTCIDEGIDGYPTIKLYKDGNVNADYFFARTLDRMKRFLSDKLIDMDQIEPNTIGVYTLNDLIFTRFIEKSDNVPVLVKYYVPWCDHCKAFREVFDELAIKFMMEESEEIKFAEVNCMDNDSLDTCTEEGVDGFPAVHLYKQGVLEDIFDGERTVDELSNFVWQTVDPSRVEHNDAMDDMLNLASLMGGGMMGGGEEEEFEECDCSEPDCDCEEEDDTEDYDDVEYTDEDDDSEGEDYEDGDDADYEDEDEELEDEEASEENIDDTSETSHDASPTDQKADAKADTTVDSESPTDKLPDTKKDEL